MNGCGRGLEQYPGRYIPCLAMVHHVPGVQASGICDLRMQRTIRQPGVRNRTLKFLITQCKRVDREGHNYTIFFAAFAGVKDVAGNNLAGLQFSFTTGASAVTTAPQVVPEPSALMLSALVAPMLMRRRRHSALI